ncbi:MAG: hypothetical protein WA902_08615 [Thermosynechococcaceae cyanobacterium]
MSIENQIEIQFPVDGQLLRVMPRAGVSVRNPDVQLPTLRSDKSGFYLEMKIEGSGEDDSEIAVTRRIPLNDLTTEEWEDLKQQYEEFDFNSCVGKGLNKGLEKIQDRKIQRLFIALLTFLNPRQVAIVLYLYREAANQKNGPTVSFRSNDLLEKLGYSRTKDGGFPSKLRSQLNRDLVSLHRTDLVFAQSLQKGKKLGAKVLIKSVLRIKDYEIDNVPRDFDLAKAADYTYELADSYTISLEFFEGHGRTGDYVLFANSIDFKQKLGSNSKNDYSTKLLIYLASRIKWDRLDENKYLYISKPYLLKSLDLLGSNASRNNQIFWRTVNELVEDQYIFSAHELPGSNKQPSIQFHINTEKIC